MGKRDSEPMHEPHDGTVTHRSAFTLDARTLAHHRAGVPLAYSAHAVGRMFATTDGPHENRVVRVKRRASATATIAPGAARSNVAVVSIDGPLAQRAETFCGYVDGYDAIAARIGVALSTPNVGAVVLRIDSPGGDVAGLEEAIRAICAERDRVGLPVLAYVDEMAASAAYWLAAAVATAGVYLPASGCVGSIGCFAPLVDETKALAQEGISVTLVRDPDGKAAEHPADPVPEKALARTQAIVRATASRFYDAIAAARGITADAARAFDGEERYGADAVAARLADGVATFDEVLALAAQRAQERAASRTTAKRAAARISGSNQKRSMKAASGDAMAIDREKLTKACEDASEALEQVAEIAEQPDSTDDDVTATATAATPIVQAALDALNEATGASGSADAAPPPPADGADTSAMAARVMRLSGKPNAVEALAEVEAWRDSHMKLAAEQAKIAAEREALETSERRKLVGELVKLGAEIPATAWADDNATAPAAHLASMPIAALRDRVAKFAAAKGGAPARGPAPRPPVAHDPASDLSERERELCERKGIDPKTYAAKKAAIAARSARRVQEN